MQEKYKQILEQAYHLFNKRNVEGVLSLMVTDVSWPNGWEGGYVRGKEEVRNYWTRQWQQLNPKVQPISFRELSDGRIEVLVHQLVLDMNQEPIFNGEVLHIYTFRDGKISHMEIESR